MSAAREAMRTMHGFGPEHPLVVVYNPQGRVVFTAMVQDLVLSALRHDPATRHAQAAAQFPLAVAVAGVFVAPVKG